MSPGDTISAEVYPSGNVVKGHRGGQQFTVIIKDVTKGWSFTTSSSVSSAQQSSAEWIAETPYGCNTASGFCLLSDFGTADYGAADAPIPNTVTASATVSGVTGALGSFGNSVQETIMVTDDRSGTPTMAQPSVLLAPVEDNGDTSFTVTWENIGP